MLRSLLLAASSFVCVVSFAEKASAFEEQFRFGGGAGVLSPSEPYSLGPALGAYGAYGISDVFDVKLELTLARVTAEPDVAAFSYGVHAALAYKLDVIQWIPYFGARAGAVGVSDPAAPFEALSPSIGGIAGIDYAMSRNLGFGLGLSFDYLISGNQLFGALLTAEYRFSY